MQGEFLTSENFVEFVRILIEKCFESVGIYVNSVNSIWWNIRGIRKNLQYLHFLGVRNSPCSDVIAIANGLHVYTVVRVF